MDCGENTKEEIYTDILHCVLDILEVLEKLEEEGKMEKLPELAVVRRRLLNTISLGKKLNVEEKQ